MRHRDAVGYLLSAKKGKYETRRRLIVIVIQVDLSVGLQGLLYRPQHDKVCRLSGRSFELRN